MTARDATSVVRGAAPDVVLGAIGALWGAVSWWFPFGRDQGLFYYVGREWFERGAVPYRDVFEQKSPLIFFVNGLIERIFGESPIPIHVVEWLLVSAIGLMAVRAAMPVGRAAPRGAYGASILLCNVFFYGFFTFQETANCETWEVFFVLASAVAARSMASQRRAALVAGALAALAVIAKPPAALLVVFPVYELVARMPDRGRARASAIAAALGCFAASASAVVAVMIGYFAAKGALPAMVDILVGANGYYNAHERPAHTPWELYRKVLQGYDWFQPCSTILLVIVGLGVGLPLLRRDAAGARRYGKGAIVLAVAYATMLLQFKFVLYHFEVLLLPVGLLGALLYEDLYEGLRRTGRDWAAFPAFAAAVIGLFLTSGFPKDNYFRAAQAVATHVVRGTSEVDLMRDFSIPNYLELTNCKLVGDFIAQHSNKDDTLLVRGYEPQIYLLAKRHYSGRFFYSAFLTLPSRAYRREEYLAEDYEAIIRRPPKLVVSFSDAIFEIDSTAWFTARGYEKRASFGRFDVLELVDRTALQASSDRK